MSKKPDPYIVEEPVTIGLVQMSMEESVDRNLSKAIRLVDQAASMGAQVVCLPELFRSPYFCNFETSSVDYSEELPGIVGAELGKCAKRNSITLVGGSVYEKALTDKFNTALVFGPSGSLLGQYRKTHIPHDPGFYEQYYFKAGDENYKIFETEVVGRRLKIGVLICYDQWFPEAARTLALMGADIIFYPTAIATVDGTEQIEGNWSDAWRTVQRGHAVANNVIVAAVNRVGREDASVFWGGSFICNAFGRVLAEGTNREEIVIATADLAHSRHVRESWRFFYERRPETYGLLTKAKVNV
jgi:predicted amidohydrolase